jgi:hypothetical protein
MAVVVVPMMALRRGRRLLTLVGLAFALDDRCCLHPSE